MILDYPGGPMQPQGNRSRRKRQKRGRRRYELPKIERKRGEALLALKMEEGIPESRTVGEKLEKARKQIFPRDSRKEHSPPSTLILAQ